MVDTAKEKKVTDVYENEADVPNIRIILKSQEVKNLDYVSNKIIELSKENKFKVSGPRYMPNKTLLITTRKGPCGNGTATFDRLEMRIHTRVIDIKCKPNNVAAITDFNIKPGVDINLKIWY